VGRADPEDQGRVDLEVGVRRRQLVLVDRDEEILLLLGVDELDKAPPDELGEVDLLSLERPELLVGEERPAVLDRRRCTACTRR
jgi:hypothetical protein